MKETISEAMPPCFDRWCQKLDPVLKTKAQKTELRHYLGGLLGEKITEEWLVKKYSERNWIEVFYREVKGWLGLCLSPVKGHIDQ